MLRARLLVRVLLCLAPLFPITGAGAQPPPASPLAILNVPVSQTPAGQASALGFSTSYKPGGRLPIALLGSISGWNHVEFGWAIPLRVGLDRVEVEPFRASGKLVVVSRREGARGFGASVIVGTELPLHDFDVVRFGVDLGVVVDWQFATNILVAGYAAIGASARYHLVDPAFQSFTTGIAAQVPITDRVHFLADLKGRIDVPGGPVAIAEGSAGIRAHNGSVFLTGSAGLSLPDLAALFRLTIYVGAGDGMRRPEERDDVEPPEDMCFETRCTAQQRAAVRRVLLPRIEEMRKRLLALAALLRARFPARTGAADTREVVRLRIDNDLSIADDGERKRELSIRFLLAAFAQSGITIDRAMAEQLLDDLQWRVQVARVIDESSVDYYTADMSSLAAAYAARLRWHAERLKDAMAALRAADAKTTEILLDIARAHVNAVVMATNGVLDFPVAPINLGLFVFRRPPIHFLGRIPQLEYKSEWGRDFGPTMEVAGTLALMVGPGGAVVEKLGGVLMPAASRIAELSTLSWNGFPVGRFLQTFLVRWMQGSAIAVRTHAAAEAGVLLRMLITREVELPDGTVRPLTADDVQEILLALTQNIATVVVTTRAEKGFREAEAEARASPGKWNAFIGKYAEGLVRRALVKHGYEKVMPIQNNSGHGIDLLIELIEPGPDKAVLGIDRRGGQIRFVEIKASDGEEAPRLSEAQREFRKFVETRLQQARDKAGRWSTISPEAQAEAARLFDLIEKKKIEVRGLVIEITKVSSPEPQVEVHPW